MTPQHDPRFHVRPASGWANDPNGPFRWRDRYHLFYQHNPDSPVHANIHWGHASSTDLVSWDHHPIALTPVPGSLDSAGCWSGCTVDDAGTPTAVYTGIDEHHTGIGAICLAQADDPDDPELSSWRPLAAPVLHGPPDELDVVMFRDPFVFRHGGRRWALVGAGHADGTPSVLLYDCEDLKAWRFAGVLLDGRDPVAAEVGGETITGWECPQLFRAGGQDDGDWVLVVSLWDGDPLSVAYLTGALRPVPAPDGGGLAFEPRTGGRLDHGRDCYAPAVLQEEGRALLWGWSWEARSQQEVDEAGWAGVLTFPREVSTHADGALRMVPAPEVAALRAPEPFVDHRDGSSQVGPVPLPQTYELQVRTGGGPAVVELLRGTGNEVLTLRLDPGAGQAVLDRSGWPRHHGDGRPAASEPVVLPVPEGESVTVRLLADGSLLEVYAGDGHAVATERIYQRPGESRELTVRADGAGTAHLRVTGWEQVPPKRA